MTVFLALFGIYNITVLDGVPGRYEKYLHEDEHGQRRIYRCHHDSICRTTTNGPQRGAVFGVYVTSKNHCQNSCVEM
jgi:hypothetical protein